MLEARLDCTMPLLTISEVASQLGIRPSTIRYYEDIGLLPPAQRVAGQRRYDQSVLYRLAVIRRSHHLGFTLEEIRQLFFGFRSDAPPSKRWHALSVKKLRELDELVESINAVRTLLSQQGRCHCASLEQCGKGLMQKNCGELVNSLSAKGTFRYPKTRVR